MVETAACWKWSSYRAHVGIDASPAWLDSDGIYGFLLGRDVEDADDRRGAQTRYMSLVAMAQEENLWQRALRQQIYLGDDAFIDTMQARAKAASLIDDEISMLHRSAPRTLAHWLANCGTREEALRRAHLDSGMSMSAIAVEMKLSVSRISRLIARAEARVPPRDVSQACAAGGAKGKT